MNFVYKLAQLTLVVALASTLLIIALVVGASRPGAAAEAATEALASPEARPPLARAMADDLRAAAPILTGVPGLDDMMLRAIESPVLAPAMSGWVEHGIRARLGHDVGPVVVEAADFGTAPDAVIALGLASIGPIQVEPAPGNGDGLAEAVTVVGSGLLLIAIVSYLLVRRGRGRAKAALLSAVAGLLTSGALLALPASAELGGGLVAIVVSVLVVPEVAIVIAGASSIVAIRALLALGGRVPYRPAGISQMDGGPIDIGFEA